MGISHVLHIRLNHVKCLIIYIFFHSVQFPFLKKMEQELSDA